MLRFDNVSNWIWDNSDPRQYLQAWKFSAELCREFHINSPPCFFPSDFSNRPGIRNYSSIPTIVHSCPAVDVYHHFRSFQASQSIADNSCQVLELEDDWLCYSDHTTSINLSSYTILPAGSSNDKSGDVSSERTAVTSCLGPNYNPYQDPAAEESGIEPLQEVSPHNGDPFGAQDNVQHLENMEEKEEVQNIENCHLGTSSVQDRQSGFNELETDASGVSGPGIRKLGSKFGLELEIINDFKAKGLRSLFKGVIKKRDQVVQPLASDSIIKVEPDILRVSASSWSRMDKEYRGSCIQELEKLIEMVEEQISCRQAAENESDAHSEFEF